MPRPHAPAATFARVSGARACPLSDCIVSIPDSARGSAGVRHRMRVNASASRRCSRQSLRRRRRAAPVEQAPHSVFYFAAIRSSRGNAASCGRNHLHVTRQGAAQIHTSLRCGVAALLLIACATARADAPAWLPVRDQNPFALGAGLPLPPQWLPRAGAWQVGASVTEGNSQLLESTAHSGVVFGAETRETRLSVAYAASDRWTLRGSLGDVWIGTGFLDGPIQRFHRLIGAPRGYRGRLGVQTPFIRVVRGGDVLYTLDRPSEGLAPLLLDAAYAWPHSERANFGVAFGTKLALGSAHALNDTGSTGLYAAAFADAVVFDATQVGARIGYLHDSGNDVLPALARRRIPFGDVYLRTPLPGDWSALLQYDLHGALYRDVPNFLGYAGVFTLGLAHPLGARTRLLLSLSEDVPIGHTQDVALQAALETRFGAN